MRAPRIKSTGRYFASKRFLNIAQGFSEEGVHQPRPVPEADKQRHPLPWHGHGEHSLIEPFVEKEKAITVSRGQLAAELTLETLGKEDSRQT